MAALVVAALVVAGAVAALLEVGRKRQTARRLGSRRAVWVVWGQEALLRMAISREASR